MLGATTHLGPGQLLTRLRLIDHSGRRRRGLPPGMLAGAGLCCATAICHGAVMAAGVLRPHGPRLRIFIDFTYVELAVAVAGAARRLGTAGQLRATPDGGEQLRIPEGGALLHQFGATTALTTWQQHPKLIPAPRTPATGFVNSNTHRAQAAAARTITRVRNALDQLGDTVPTELAHAARLRLQHPQASLPQLGSLSDPPISKDTISGRLRRLLTLADRRAA